MCKDLKEALRKRLKARRETLASALRIRAALALRDNVLAQQNEMRTQRIIASYYPLGAEIDPLPLMAALEEKGHSLALPWIEKRVSGGHVLTFRAYRLGDPVKPGPYAAPQPLATASEVQPDILLIPLLGFDRRGGRLGQGGGFYDRTLAFLRTQTGPHSPWAIGLAYAFQEEPLIPREAHDELLDAVATDKEVIKPTAS